MLLRFLLSVLVLYGSCTMLLAEETAAPDFASQVAPILTKYCAGCHGDDEPDGQLSLASFEGIAKGGEHGAVLVAGDGQASRLVQVLTGAAEPAMPPEDNERPTAEEIALLKSWIDAGAKGPTGKMVDPRVLVTPKIATNGPVRRAISAVEWSADGKHLLVARYNVVEVIDAATRQVVRTLGEHHGQINALGLSKDGQTLAAAGGEAGLFGEVRLWNLQSGETLRTTGGHRDAVYAVAFSDDGKLLATGSYDQEIKLWDATSGAEVRTLSGHNGPIFDLQFSSSGRVLASCSGDRTSKLWDVSTGQRLETFGQPLEELYSLALSPDGRRIIAGGDDNRLRLWNISESAAEGTNPIVYSRFAHEGAIIKVALSPDGELLASSGDDKAIKLWKTGDLTLDKLLEPQADVAPAVAFSPDGKRLASGRLDGELLVFDVASGKTVDAVPPPKPELSYLEPFGIQAGVPTKVRLVGKHLAGCTEIKTSHEKLTAKLLDLEQAGPEQIFVELRGAEDLPTVAHEVSVVTAGGESNRIAVHADDLPQLSEVEPNDGPAGAMKLAKPASVWGTLTSRADLDYYALEISAGETVVLQLAATSLQSKLNGTLTLFDPRGAVVARNNDHAGADPLLGYTAKEAGVYKVRVADLVRSGSDDHFYRLSVGAFPVVTGVFPLAVRPDQTSSVELSGLNIPAGTTVEVQAPASGEVAVAVDRRKFRSSGPIKVLVGSADERVEVEPNDGPDEATELALPGVLNGRIHRINGPDRDLVRIRCKAGQKWIIETQAARRGSPIDTQLEVLHADGSPVQRMLLHAVRDSNIDFRGVDSNNRGVRLKNWEEMDLDQYVYFSGEVNRIWRMPRGPDSELLLYESAGKRRTYFDTTAVAHALYDPAYIVEPHPVGAALPANGLPVFPLHYFNDDDGERKLGRDSRLVFEAPADGDYLIRIGDALDRQGPELCYRLIVREPKPDFVVRVAGVNPAIGAGSAKEFTVVADRIDGFEGEISVALAGQLPTGVQASFPLLIQKEQSEARGVIFESDDAVQGSADAGELKIIATAKIGEQEVRKEFGGLGKVAVAAKPKLTVELLPDGAAGASDRPREITIAPGQMVPALIRIERNGFDGRVDFNVENLPYGVIVDNIGLSGVSIPEGQTERQIFFTAAPWVPETSRLCHAVTGSEGGQASPPLMLHVRKQAASATAAVSP